jgi:branched-chain amino acid transport system ATP-binding protein
VAAESAPSLQLQGVHASYGRIEVVHGVDLTIRRGELVALLGANGAGKSTTVRVAAGLHVPDRGAVRVAGRVVNGVAPRKLARLGVCTVPEGRGIFANLSVEDNLWLASHTGVARARIEEVAFGWFPRLAGRRHQLAGSLSGGEQQMLAIARALSVDPVVLLVDELSTGLAPLVVEMLYEVVQRSVSEGVSVLAVEQFAHAVLPIADRVAVMAHGSIVAEGEPSSIEKELAEHYLGSD